MITENTVLVLGAGASIPYGFPSGSKLTKDIIWNTYPSGYPTGLFNPEFIEIVLAETRIRAFGQVLSNSGLISMDEFLEHRQDFKDIGKLAIALEISKREHHDTLFKIDNKDNWYKYLFSKLRTKDFDDFGKNKISFVTYNYDRSLEQFLFTAIKNTYNKDDVEVAEKLKKIKIIHILV